MDWAFSPFGQGGVVSRGVAPVWFKAAPLALVESWPVATALAGIPKGDGGRWAEGQSSRRGAGTWERMNYEG
jgi:hypothetical protein